MLAPALRLVRRDLMLALRGRADALAPLLFFLMVASLFPLALGPRPEQLRQIAPAVLWVGALLAAIVGMHRLFEQDAADGTLEQLLLADTPLALLVLAKVLAHWLVTGLPLVLAAPLLALQYDMGGPAMSVLTVGLLLGTPILSLVGAIGAALTLSARGASVLLALLLLPLYIPALIIGASAAAAAANGMDASSHLTLLAGLLLAAAVLAPWSAACALRIACD
jgi:heme exporter protein B